MSESNSLSNNTNFTKSELFWLAKFIGFILLIILIIAAMKHCGTHEQCNDLSFILQFEYLVERYQTLLSALFALLVGFITLKGIREQIFEDRLARVEQREIAYNVFVRATHDYLNRLRAALKNIAAKNPSPTDGSTLIFVDINSKQIEFLTHPLPHMLTDWHYLTTVPEPAVEGFLKVRTWLDLIYKSSQNLAFEPNGAGEMRMVKAVLDNFADSLYKDAEGIYEVIGKPVGFQRHR